MGMCEYSQEERKEMPDDVIPSGIFLRYQIAFAIFRLHGLICQLNVPFPLSSSVTLAMAEVVNIGGVSPGHNSATRYPTNGK